MKWKEKILVKIGLYLVDIYHSHKPRFLELKMGAINKVQVRNVRLNDFCHSSVSSFMGDGMEIGGVSGRFV